MNNLLLGPQSKQTWWPEGQGVTARISAQFPLEFLQGIVPHSFWFLEGFPKKAQQLSLSAFISRWQISLENKEGFLEPPQEQRESSEWFPVG